ncbi:MAG: hypothetical protein HY907_11255 [Deltaproteobacteria bacterium]|nr:hypothetical protein [Deltaproteobacteria bacterium]
MATDRNDEGRGTRNAKREPGGDRSGRTDERELRAGPSTKNRQPRTTPALLAGVLSFAATLALCGPWWHGPANARAEDPSLVPAEALPVVQGFVPAVADGGVNPAQPTTIGKTTLRAWLGRNEAGEAGILVELRSAADAETTVRCRVSLKVFRFPDVSPMARLLPEPEITEVFERELSERVGAGAVRVVVLPVDADSLPEPPEPPAFSPTHGQIVLEALDDA